MSKIRPHILHVTWCCTIQLEGIIYIFFIMKEHDYNMKLLITFGPKPTELFLMKQPRKTKKFLVIILNLLQITSCTIIWLMTTTIYAMLCRLLKQLGRRKGDLFEYFCFLLLSLKSIPLLYLGTLFGKKVIHP